MRRYLYSAFLVFSWCCGRASPPIYGGFATGPDSAQYLFWFHSNLYAYEQGIAETGGELNLAPGDVTGVYTVAQRADFPLMTYMAEFSVKINPADMYPGLPGDQFSGFTYAVYRPGSDSIPSMPPLRSGQNSLCGGIPCSEEWAANPIGLLNAAGEDRWLGFQWSETTPSAPQIRCRILPEAGAFNRIGSVNGGEYSWNMLDYAAQFRTRFWGVMPSPLSSRYGQRVSSPTSVPPDSFIIHCFGSDSILTYYIGAADTLILKLPGKYDSASIASIYDITVDTSRLMVAFRAENTLPVNAVLDYSGKSSAEYPIDLMLTNMRVDPITLVIGCDTTKIRGNGSEVIIDSRQTAAVPLAIAAADGDSVSSIIIIQDEAGEYYPLLMPVDYPPDQQTAVTDTQRGAAHPPFGFDIYPNPTPGVIMFRPYNRAAGATFEIFNITGRKVAEVTADAGNPAVWDGCDRQGRAVRAGIYLARMAAGEVTICRKVVLLR